MQKVCSRPLLNLAPEVFFSSPGGVYLHADLCESHDIHFWTCDMTVTSPWPSPFKTAFLNHLRLRCCFGSLHYSRHTTGFPAVPKIAPPNGKRFDFSVEHFAWRHVSLTRRHPLRLTSADEASFQIELSVVTTLSADASFAISPRNVIVNGSLMTIHGGGVGGVNKTHWSLVGLGYESWEPLINLFQTNVRDRDSAANLKTTKVERG